MSLNQILGQCVPGVNSPEYKSIRVDKLYLDNLYGDCYTIPFPDSYFISDGTQQLPTPKASFTLPIDFAKIDILPVVFPPGPVNLSLSSVFEFITVPGLTVGPPGIFDTLIFSEPGEYYIIMNITFLAGSNFNFAFTPFPGSFSKDFYIPTGQTLNDTSVVYASYYNLAPSDVPFNCSILANQSSGLSTKIGSHLTILKL